jgi:hypothetical protein
MAERILTGPINTLFEVVPGITAEKWRVAQPEKELLPTITPLHWVFD